MAKELQRYNMDITALSETRIANEGHFTEKSGGYTFYWSDKDEGCKREAGVAFAIKTEIVSNLEELPCGFSDRLMSMRFPLLNNRYVTLVSVYAPTMTYSDDEKLTFYLALKELVRKIPHADKIIVLGDFNARVGKDFQTWNVIGRHGVGNCNSNGLLLLQMCAELELCIGNTMFQQKDKYKTTWMHPGSKQWHLIDYILTRKRDMRDFCSVRVMRGAECWTDHRLVRAKVKFVVKPKVRAKGLTLPKRVNVSRLKDEAVRDKLVQKMDELDCQNEWEDFKESVYGVCTEVLGFADKKHQDWFDENNMEVQVLLEEKTKALSALLKGGLSTEETTRLSVKFREVKGNVQQKLRAMQNTWWSAKADQIQCASNTNNSKLLYNLLREVYGPSSSPVAPLRTKDSKLLLRDPKDILNRWQEHFDELLNRSSQVDEEFIRSIPCSLVKAPLAEAPSFEEDEAAVMKLNSVKIPRYEWFERRSLEVWWKESAATAYCFVAKGLE